VKSPSDMRIVKNISTVTMTFMILLAVLLLPTYETFLHISNKHILVVSAISLARTNNRTQLSTIVKVPQIPLSLRVRQSNNGVLESIGSETQSSMPHLSLNQRTIIVERNKNITTTSIDSMPSSPALSTLLKLGTINNNNNHNTSSTLLSNNNIPSPGRSGRREVSPTNTTKQSILTTGLHSPEPGRRFRILLVKPTFTAAAYANGFYKFYRLYNNTPAGINITTDLNLLSIPVNASWYPSISYVFSMLKLVSNIKLLAHGSNITVVGDAEADKGFMFAKNGTNIYDLIILGHQEYVTQREYDNFRNFVANGGTMIVLDGNVFYAEVKYDRQSNIVTLVKGHYWAYNGRSAWKSIAERWRNETAQWIGSNYLCYLCVNAFVNNPFGYQPHEEQYLDNPHDTILLNYNASIPRKDYPSTLRLAPIVATYELNYKKGKVITLGIYSDDVITNHKFDSYFDSLLSKHGMEGIAD
jgi:hypothetical protein